MFLLEKLLTGAVSKKHFLLAKILICSLLSGSHITPVHLNFFSKIYVLLKSTPFPPPISIKTPFFLQLEKK